MAGSDTEGSKGEPTSPPPGAAPGLYVLVPSPRHEMGPSGSFKLESSIPPSKSQTDWSNAAYQLSFLSAAIAISLEAIPSVANVPTPIGLHYLALVSIGVMLSAVLWAEFFKSLELLGRQISDFNNLKDNETFSTITHIMSLLFGLIAMGLSMDAIKQILVNGTDPSAAFSLRSHANIALLAFAAACVLLTIATTYLDHKPQESSTQATETPNEAPSAPHPIWSFFKSHKLSTSLMGSGIAIETYNLTQNFDPILTSISLALVMLPFLFNAFRYHSGEDYDREKFHTLGGYATLQSVASKTSSVGVAIAGIGAGIDLFYPGNSSAIKIMLSGAGLAVIGVLISMVAAALEEYASKNNVVTPLPT